MERTGGQVETLERRLAVLAGVLGRPAEPPGRADPAPGGVGPVRWLVCGRLAVGVPDLLPMAEGGGTSAVFRMTYGERRDAVLVPLRTPEGAPAPEQQLSIAKVAAWARHPRDHDALATVDHTALTAPHNLLARGLEIIDTLGLGGVHGPRCASAVALGGRRAVHPVRTRRGPGPAWRARGADPASPLRSAGGPHFRANEDGQGQ